MIQKLFLVCVLAASCAAHAQKASIKKVELAGEKIIVYYDLEDSNPSNEYKIQLYTSQSNFATALTKVKGDVGPEIKPGYDKKIEWRVREEIGPYKGRLSLEIRGQMFMAVARINNISGSEKFKRGKTQVITWRPGNNNPVNIELMKGGQTIKSELNQPNNGSFNLFIPQHTKTGDDYFLRITDTKNSGDFVVSQPFNIRRKVPMLLKVLPVVAVGGAVLLMGGGGSSSPPSGNGGGGEGIPDPPNPE